MPGCVNDSDTPKSASGRLEWLKKKRSFAMREEWKASARKRYGAAADSIKNAEAFEITEYGLQPSEEEIRRLLPFFD